MSILDKKIKEACEQKYNRLSSYSGKEIIDFAKIMHENYSESEDKLNSTISELLGKEIYDYIFHSDGTNNIAITPDKYYFVRYEDHGISFSIDDHPNITNAYIIYNKCLLERILNKIKDDIQYAVDCDCDKNHDFVLKNAKPIIGADPAVIQRWFAEYSKSILVDDITM